jgi:hypothetical protein
VEGLVVRNRLKMLRGENTQTRRFGRAQRDPKLGPNPRHSGRATRDPESNYLPMDSRFRGNDKNRAGSHRTRQSEQIEQAHALDAAIAANLKELGYGR